MTVHSLAQYGLNVHELNMLIETAFAGGKAGVIFEGEKRFDLVVRLKEANRTSIEDIRGMYVNTAYGRPNTFTGSGRY